MTQTPPTQTPQAPSTNILEQIKDGALNYSIPGSKTLLIGDSGAGKTDAIVSLVEAGVKPFILFTEPGMATIAKACKRRGVDLNDIHWAYLAQTNQGWASMINMADMVNKLSLESLTKLTDPNKAQHRQFINLMLSCNNFICERTSMQYGDVSTWNTDRALVIDSMSGLNEVCMSLVVGERPTKSQADWQIAQANVKTFLKKILTGLRCHVVMTGHLEREKNEVTGEIQVMVSSLGKKLAPDIPRNFDDVILVDRVADKFSWSTARAGVVTKARNVPLGDNLQPSFVPLVKQWLENGGKILPTTTEVKPLTAQVAASGR